MKKKKWIKYSLITLTCVILLGSFLLVSRYQYLSNMGDESRYRPDEHQVRVDVTEISEEHSKQNFRSFDQPIYASGDILIKDDSYNKITNFDDYVAYAKSNKLAYKADNLYTEEPPTSPKKSQTQYFPMVFTANKIDLTQRYINEIVSLYKLPENNHLNDDLTNNSQLLLLTSAEITFQPFLPGIVPKDITFRYKDNTLTTPVWVSHRQKEKHSDLDYIFLYKDDLQDFFARDFEHLSLSSYKTYKKENFGFTTQNEEAIIYPGNFNSLKSDYTAVVSEARDDEINSVLDITIRNQKTHEEKTFRKHFTTDNSPTDIETLVQLVTGNWDYTYNH